MQHATFCSWMGATSVNLSDIWCTCMPCCECVSHTYSDAYWADEDESWCIIKGIRQRAPQKLCTSPQAPPSRGDLDCDWTGTAITLINGCYIREAKPAIFSTLQGPYAFGLMPPADGPKKKTGPKGGVGKKKKDAGVSQALSTARALGDASPFLNCVLQVACWSPTSKSEACSPKTVRAPPPSVLLHN